MRDLAPRPKKARSALVALISASILLLGTACGSATETGTDPDGDRIVTFGVQTSLTGEVADFGIPQLNTIEMWMERMNAEGGIQIGGEKYRIELKSYDNKSDVSQDAPLTTRLITDDQVDLLFGPVSSLHAGNACPVSERYQIPSLNTFAFVDSVYERGFEYCFSAQSSTSGQYDAVANLAAAAGLENIVLVVSSDELGAAFEDHFTHALEKNGLSPSHVINFPADTQNFSTILAEVESKSPDLVGFQATPAPSVLFRQQQVAFGVTADLSYFESGPSGAGLGWEATGDAGISAIGQAAWTPAVKGMEPDENSIWGTNAEFVQEYAETFGVEPDAVPWAAAVTAVAADVYTRALTEAGTLDPKAVRDAISEMSGQNFYGPIEFDERGVNMGPAASALVVQVQGSGSAMEYNVVWPQDQATADLMLPDPHQR